MIKNNAIFKKATRQIVKLKLAITGVAGAGKTMSALRLARGIVGEQGRIAYLDTENKSSSLYSDRFDFDVLAIDPPFLEKNKFITPINEAVEKNYDLVVIDSASHFYQAALDLKSQLDSRGNQFGNWGRAIENFNSILFAILQSDIHVIVCLRSKIEYVVERNENGRTTVSKVGLTPIFRTGTEHEFTTVFDLDIKHNATADKDRTGLFENESFRITEETGQKMASWMQQKTRQPIAPDPSLNNSKVKPDSSSKPLSSRKVEELSQGLDKYGLGKKC